MKERRPKMAKYMLKKILMLVLTLLAVSFVVFAAFSILPGDPALQKLGTEATPEKLEALREQMGLNAPFLVRYGKWLMGMLTFDFNTEKIDSIFSMLSNVFKSDACLTYSDASSGADYSAFGSKYTYCRTLFAQDHFLFVQSSMGTSQQMSDMDGDGYGIAPNPKYNKDQERYSHKMDKLSNIWGIPNSTQLDYDMIANVMDYWAYESSKTVMPAYYEITIKTRRINDPYDSTMLDLIKSTICYDVSEVFGIDVTDVLWSGYTTNAFSSAWAGQKRVIDKQVKKFNSDMEALG